VLLSLIGVQPALIFGVFAFFGEFLPTIGAFLVSIPILLVALSMGATKFWLALAVIVLIYQIELNVLVPGARQRNAIAPGQHSVFYPGGRRIIWAFGSVSRGACCGVGTNCYRRILFAPPQHRFCRA
jgi:hypothetical protein